jgi:hypothetical protein
MGGLSLYYMLKDMIFFYNTRTTYLRSLVPLKDSKAVTGSWYCVKVSNGNIYVVYEVWDLNNRDELRVYNLRKDKTLYSVAYRKNDLRASKLEGYPDKYSYILANYIYGLKTYKLDSDKTSG